MAKLFLEKEKDVIGTDKQGRKFKFDRLITKINGRPYSVKVKSGSAFDTLNGMFEKSEKIELHHKIGDYEDFNTGEIKNKDVIYVVDPDGDDLEVKAADSYAKTKIIKALTQ